MKCTSNTLDYIHTMMKKGREINYVYYCKKGILITIMREKNHTYVTMMRQKYVDIKAKNLFPPT